MNIELVDEIEFIGRKIDSIEILLKTPDINKEYILIMKTILRHFKHQQVFLKKILNYIKKYN